MKLAACSTHENRQQRTTYYPDELWSTAQRGDGWP